MKPDRSKPSAATRPSTLNMFCRDRTRPAASPLARRARVALEPLEGRIAPAVAGVLSLSGSALIYTAFNTGGSHAVNVTTSGSGFTVNDTAGTILSMVPGFSGTGTNTVTGAIPALASTVKIQAASGTTTVNLGAAGAGLSLPNDALVVSANAIASLNTVTARSITLNAGAAGTAIGSSLVSTAGSLVLNGPANETVNAALSATGGDVDINGSLSGAGHTLTINDSGGSVTSAGSLTGLIGLMIAPAQNITLGAASVAGPVVLTANKNVTLNGALNDAGSTVTIQANWTGTGAGNFTQNVGGDIGGTPVSVSILLNNGGGTGSAIVRGITTAPGASVTINALGTGTGGAIIDGNGPGVTNVTAGFLAASAGPGGVNLDTQVGTLTSVGTSSSAGSLAPIFIRNSGGPVLVPSATTQNGPVSITEANGDLTVYTVTAGGTNQTVALTTTGSGDVIFGNNGLGIDGHATAPATVTVNSAGNIENANGDDNVLTAHTVNMTATGGIGVGAGFVMTVDASVVNATAGASGVYIHDFGNSTPVNFNNVTTTGNTPIVIQSEVSTTLTNISTANAPITVATVLPGNTLTVVSVSAGNNNSVDLDAFNPSTIALGTVTAGTGTVTVQTAGNVAGPGLITAGTVNLFAFTGIGLPGAANGIEVNLSGPAVVSAQDVNSGGISINSVGTLPVNFGTGLPGIVTNGTGNIELHAAGAATLGNGSNAVSANNGSVTVTSAGLMTVNNVNTSPSNGPVSLATTGGANVQLAAGSIHAGTGSVTINSSGAILDASPAVAAGTVNLTAVTNIGTSGTPVTTAAAVVNATAGTGLWLSNPSGTVNYNNIAGGQIGITSGGPTTVTNASSSTAAIVVNVTGASLTVGTITDPGNIVQLSTSGSGDVALGSVTGGVVIVNSAGQIIGGSSPIPGAANATAAAVSLTAATGIGTGLANPVRIAAPFVSATTATGGVWIDSVLTSAVTFTGVSATTSGPIALTAESNVDFTGPVTAASGSVSITDNGGAITLNASVSGSAVTVNGSGDVTNNATITGPGGVTVTAGTNSSAANLTNNGTVTNGAGSGNIAFDSGASSNTTMNLGGAITANGGGNVTITGGNVGNAISLTAVVTTVGGGNLTINGGAGIDTIGFNLGGGSSISGNVAINAQASAATLNVTDPTATEVTGTFTIDFGAGHTTSDTLNIFGTGAALVPVGATPPTVPTGVTFTAGYTSWVLSNFIVGQDHLPGFGY